MFYFIFQSTGEETETGDADAARLDGLPPDYSTETWRPAWNRLTPPTLGPKFLLWWVLHACGIFRNGGYAVVIIRRRGVPVHRTCLIPKYFRWPFMRDEDLQVSSTWTHPDYRNLGLATRALRHALREWSGGGRAFWYVAHAGNAASIAVCRKSAFRMVALANRRSRFGIRMLGELEPLERASAGLPPCLSPAGGYKASSVPADSGAK
jgi:RimJ/RimL family protein N-acetyltransferase